MNAGDICGSSELQLSKIFDLVARWEGIVLLDEADVYMQQRTLDNPNGNFLVSSKFPINLQFVHKSWN